MSDGGKNVRQPAVLVVGAGPTGLAAALVLTKLGIPVRVIDKNSAPSDKSKALGVQAGTLECLEKSIDKAFVQQMIDAGRPTRAAWIHLNDSAPIQIDLSTIPSAYNFILILEQSETEKILEQRLNELSVKVERQTELIHTQDRGSEVVSKIKRSNGDSEEIISSFVIGCDGAHSTVRRLLDIPFKGSAYTGDFVLGDVTLQWPWPYGSVQTFVSKRGVIASFPMKGEQRYRLILIPKEISASSDGQEISLKEFQSLLSELSLDKISALNATWLTRFRVHHRMVQHFQKGRIFLAGDAAHIHSPAGGQGMNTGIQDALNLGFKLKKVISEGSPLSLLKGYERERLPVARKVLRGTDFVFRMALLPETPPLALMRRTLLPKVVGSKLIQRRVATAISEISVARREIEHYATNMEIKNDNV